MRAVAAFFGPQADHVLAHCRQTEANRRAVAQLSARLDSLRSERSQLHRQHDREIAERTSRVAETEATLARARKQAAALNGQRDRLARSLGNFWTRLGILLRHWFASGAPGVQQVRDLLASVARDAQLAEDRVDALSAAQAIELADLRRLTVPIESVEYAIGFLEQLQQSLGDEVARHESLVREQIRQTVRATDLTLLRGKLAALPEAIDRPALIACVLRLKSLLNYLPMPSADVAPRRMAESAPGDEPSRGSGPPAAHAGNDDLVTAELGGDPLEGILRAIEAGFSSDTADGSAQIHLQGEGRKNVRRTRRRAVSPHDRRHKSGLQHRTETYWEQVPVKLSGTLQVPFAVRYPRWRPNRLVETLRDESQAWFRVGAARAQDKVAGTELAKVLEEAERLTAEIRGQLERAAAAT